MTRSLRRVGKGLPERPDWKHFARELSQGSDRAVALLSVSYLDQLMKFAISTVLARLSGEQNASELFDDFGVLYAFSSKIKMAGALGMIGPQTRSNLNAIRDIRNIFAHSAHPISFRTPEIRKGCLILQRLPLRYRVSKAAFRSARDRFTTTVIELAPSIYVNALAGIGQGATSEWMNPLP